MLQASYLFSWSIALTLNRLWTHCRFVVLNGLIFRSAQLLGSANTASHWAGWWCQRQWEGELEVLNAEEMAMIGVQIGGAYILKLWRTWEWRGGDGGKGGGMCLILEKSLGWWERKDDWLWLWLWLWPLQMVCFLLFFTGFSLLSCNKQVFWLGTKPTDTS